MRTAPAGITTTESRMPPKAEPRSIVRCVPPTSVPRVERQGLELPAPNSGEDWLAVEAPLELRVLGDPFVTTMRTPGHDRDLLLGWLYYEGLIETASDISSLSVCHGVDASSRGNVYELVPAAGMSERLRGRDASLLARTQQTSCGICGRQTIDDLLARTKPVHLNANWSAPTIRALLHQLSAEQPLFHQTGCTHAAALGTSEGKLLATREDVGRHNAVDKLIGSLLRSKELPAAPDHALIISSRASFEIVHKAVMAGFSAVFALSAPTTLAVDLAQQAGILLAGFLRGGKFNVYTQHARVTEGAS